MSAMNIKNFKISIMIFMISIAGIASCTTTHTAKSTTPLAGRYYAELGRSEGHDTTWSVFGLWMIGRADIDDAINEAVSLKGGDAMIEVTSTETSSCFLLFSTHRVTAEGMVIKFAAPGEAGEQVGDKDAIETPQK